MRFSVYIVCPSVLNCSNLKLHQTSEVKNIFKQEKIMLQLTFNPGLMLTGFRTTRPRRGKRTVNTYAPTEGFDFCEGPGTELSWCSLEKLLFGSTIH